MADDEVTPTSFPDLFTPMKNNIPSFLKPRDHVLFMGDSVTHAHRRPEELHDCYYLGGGYAKMIAAELNADYPQLALRFSNRGECGHGVRELELRWQRDCLELKPTVLSVMIGINDSNPNLNPPQSLAEFERTYRKLLTAARDAMPDLRLVLMEPFGFVPEIAPPAPAVGCDPARVERVRARQPIVASLAAEFGARWVPLAGLFEQAMRDAPPEHWALDGVHPSAAGHLLMARAWLRAIA